MRQASDCFLTNAYVTLRGCRRLVCGDRHTRLTGYSARPYSAMCAAAPAARFASPTFLPRKNLRVFGTGRNGAQRLVRTAGKRAFLRASAPRVQRDDSSCSTLRRMLKTA
ncbi:protein of unknown function [Paraburkholderia dioscoreae]|uniref:Uncharacterized protein n=1 Tax=Paraburkholderia dioscoreae TaxID=2604047 RepID=A0A5Q4ZFR1_9BURK|nr:protein of unknown function [Paraburkholderia dioscoreae]